MKEYTNNEVANEVAEPQAVYSYTPEEVLLYDELSAEELRNIELAVSGQSLESKKQYQPDKNKNKINHFMEIIFREDCLKELYEEGKTKHKWNLIIIINKKTMI